MALVETNCWLIVNERKGIRPSQHGWGLEDYRVPEVRRGRSGYKARSTARSRDKLETDSSLLIIVIIIITIMIMMMMIIRYTIIIVMFDCLH